jgi:hypothetical protein
MLPESLFHLFDYIAVDLAHVPCRTDPGSVVQIKNLSLPAAPPCIWRHCFAYPELVMSRIESPFQENTSILMRSLLWLFPQFGRCEPGAFKEGKTGLEWLWLRTYGWIVCFKASELIQLDNQSGRGYQDYTQGEMGGAVRLEAPVQPWPESFYPIQVTMEVRQDV